VSPLFVVVLLAAAVSHFVSTDFLGRLVERFTALPVLVQSAAYAGLIVLFAGLSFGGPNFIYFQF
jgi:hypothetical protein